MRRLYSNSPISEALIDIRVDPAITCNEKEFKRVGRLIAPNSSDVKPRYLLDAKINLGESGKVEHQRALDGYQFWSEDKQEVYQVRYQGYSYSKLAPYDSWDNCLPKVLEGWKVFHNEFKPGSVTRLATKYVNNIIIKDKEISLSDYITNLSQMPEILSQGSVKQFTTRVEVELSDEVLAIVTIGNRPTGVVEEISVLLDIDVISNTLIDISEDSSCDIIAERLNDLHGKAEEVFESIITDKARGLFGVQGD